MYNVVLHNDDEHTAAYARDCIIEIVKLSHKDATDKVLEAHETGRSILKTIHLELAELYQAQLEEKGLQVTIEIA